MTLIRKYNKFELDLAQLDEQGNIDLNLAYQACDATFDTLSLTIKPVKSSSSLTMFTGAKVSQSKVMLGTSTIAYKDLLVIIKQTPAHITAIEVDRDSASQLAHFFDTGTSSTVKSFFSAFPEQVDTLVIKDLNFSKDPLGNLTKLLSTIPKSIKHLDLSDCQDLLILDPVRAAKQCKKLFQALHSKLLSLSIKGIHFGEAVYLNQDNSENIYHYLPPSLEELHLCFRGLPSLWQEATGRDVCLFSDKQNIRRFYFYFSEYNFSARQLQYIPEKPLEFLGLEILSTHTMRYRFDIESSVDIVFTTLMNKLKATQPTVLDLGSCITILSVHCDQWQLQELSGVRVFNFSCYQLSYQESLTAFREGHARVHDELINNQLYKACRTVLPNALMLMGDPACRNWSYQPSDYFDTIQSMFKFNKNMLMLLLIHSDRASEKNYLSVLPIEIFNHIISFCHNALNRINIKGATLPDGNLEKAPMLSRPSTVL